MQSQGPNSGTTFTNNTSVGDVSWTNPGNAAASDNLYATASLGTADTTDTTYYLMATGFGFNIPNGVTISGVVVEVERRASGSGVRDYSVRLVVANTAVGSNNAFTATDWPTTDTYVTYGSATDLWGLTLTPADINSGGFGVAISATNTSTASRTAYIDHIRITIYYTLGMQIMTQII